MGSLIDAAQKALALRALHRHDLYRRAESSVVEFLSPVFDTYFARRVETRTSCLGATPTLRMDTVEPVKSEFQRLVKPLPRLYYSAVMLVASTTLRHFATSLR